MRIAFVYLGARLPVYAMLNIWATARRFPDHQVWLISDRNVNVLGARLLGARGWKCSDPASAWPMVREQTRFRLDFRRGFWFLTVARLFAIAEFMENSDAESLLHVEADVWLAPSFPWAELSEIDTDFAYPLVSATLGVASTLYIANAPAAQDLVHLAEASASSGAWLTDMELLSSLQRDAPHRVTVLPSMTAESEAFLEVAQPDLRLCMTEHSERFGGVFDGSAWGVDLLGEDPRNHWGVLRLFRREPFGVLDTPKVPLAFTAQRDVSVGGNPEARIHTLHVHSKDWWVFAFPGRRLAQRVRQRASGPRAAFLPHVLLRVLWSLGLPWVGRRLKRLGRFRAGDARGVGG